MRTKLNRQKGPNVKHEAEKKLCELRVWEERKKSAKLLEALKAIEDFSKFARAKEEPKELRSHIGLIECIAIEAKQEYEAV